VVTDLAEVFRLGTAKAGENLAFRRYLAKHRHPSGPFQALAGEVQRVVDCTACANCCKHSIVTVSAEEIAGIARHLGFASEAISSLYTEPDPEDGAGRILKNCAGGCVFLDGNLCMVYDARPKTCRDFPHVAEGSHSLGSRRASVDRWAALCPIIYNAIEQYKHLLGFRPDRAGVITPEAPG
jgi:Fe-S-cluster containining protein